MIKRMTSYEEAKGGFYQERQTEFDRTILNVVRPIALRGRNKSPLLYSDMREDTPEFVSKAAIMTALGELVREERLEEREWKGNYNGYKRRSKTQMAWEMSDTVVGKEIAKRRKGAR